MKSKIRKPEEEWKKALTKEQFHILREKGTERAFTGKYHNNKKKGAYYCVACKQKLFDSKTKFDSGTGWPSFYSPASEESVEMKRDLSHFMVRTEALCSKCKGHLGHVFADGPRSAGKRCCINSAALEFKEKKK